MADWFVNVDGSTTGPHPAEHVVHWVNSGQVPRTALLWPDGGTAWLPVEAAWPALTGDRAPVADSSQGGGASPSGNTVAAGNTVASDGPAQQGPSPYAAAPGQPGQPGMPGPTGMAGPTGMPGPTGPGMPGASDQLSGRGGVFILTDRLADFAGVERLEGFRLRELLSATFRRYGRDEVEQHFATGLPGYTPDLEQIPSGWPKPWMFTRLFGITALLFFGFLLLTEWSANAKLLPGLIMLGSFAVPTTVLVFFFEINSPRNVSLYVVLNCMIVGGLISLALTLGLTSITSVFGDLARYIDPILVGVVEETAKLLAVFLIMWRNPPNKYPWILNGMLFGAAVGAGFACFESAGYAFITLLEGGLDHSVQVIVVRGFLAPFGHVVWTALAAGALWRVKLDQRLNPSMLASKRVLRILLVVMTLHTVWDLTAFEPPFLVKYLVLGFVAWVVAFGMLTSGLKQIKAAQLASQGGYPQVSGATQVLRNVGSISS
jgi:RsiW-degrading membrane proteinase PrsW (M82 family)